ncbi:MAG: outer membrane protein assembly factor BamD, partial [Syntrophales bacterium LBB04]|nr:outer membrane protein assembly factor BamD [Syntrophales bacterium LBB04]
APLLVIIRLCRALVLKKHAARVYEHFTELYPGSEKVEYALYRAIDCSFHQISNADRDQTDTEKTLALVNKFLERSDLFSNYLPQVTEIGTKCKERLFESEMNVFSFYVGRGNFKSAQHRLENITKVYTPQLPNIEPQILHLKIELAQATNDTEGLIKTRIELAEKFPENSFAKPLVTQLPQLKLELAALTKPAEVSTTQAAEDKNIQQHMAQRF